MTGLPAVLAAPPAALIVVGALTLAGAPWQVTVTGMLGLLTATVALMAADARAVHRQAAALDAFLVVHPQGSPQWLASRGTPATTPTAVPVPATVPVELDEAGLAQGMVLAGIGAVVAAGLCLPAIPGYGVALVPPVVGLAGFGVLVLAVEARDVIRARRPRPVGFPACDVCAAATSVGVVHAAEGMVAVCAGCAPTGGRV